MNTRTWMNEPKNPRRRWKYLRFSRSAVESLEAANRMVPHDYKHCDTQPGQWIFRKRLPEHVIDAGFWRVHDGILKQQVIESGRAPGLGAEVL